MKIRIFGIDVSVADALRRIRLNTGANSAEFAARLKDAGLTDSKVENFVEYEAGKKAPSLPTLAEILDKAGYQIIISKKV